MSVLGDNEVISYINPLVPKELSDIVLYSILVKQSALISVVR